MQLHTIAVQVRDMRLERETDYASGTFPYPKIDVTKIVMSREREDETPGPFSNVALFVSIPAGAPNPFTLGQRLTLSLDPDAKAAPVSFSGPTPEPGPDGHPYADDAARVEHEDGPALRDDASGLGEQSGYCGTNLTLVGAGV